MLRRTLPFLKRRSGPNAHFRKPSPRKAPKQKHERSVKGAHGAPGYKAIEKKRIFISEDTERYAAFQSEYLGLPSPANSLPILPEQLEPGDISDADFEKMVGGVLYGNTPVLTPTIRNRIEYLQSTNYLSLAADETSEPTLSLVHSSTPSCPSSLSPAALRTADSGKSFLKASTEKAIALTLTELLPLLDQAASRDSRAAASGTLPSTSSRRNATSPSALLFKLDNQISQLLRAQPPTPLAANLAYITSLAPVSSSRSLLTHLLGPKTVMWAFVSAGRHDTSATYELADTMTKVLDDLSRDGRDYWNVAEIRASIVHALPYKTANRREGYEAIVSRYGTLEAATPSPPSNTAAAYGHGLLSVYKNVNPSNIDLRNDLLREVGRSLDLVMMTSDTADHCTEFYNARMRLAAVTGEVETTVNLLNDMRDTRVPRSLHSYVHSFQALEKSIKRDSGILESNEYYKPGPAGTLPNHQLLDYYSKILNDVIVRMENEDRVYEWVGDDLFGKNELVRAVSSVFFRTGDTPSAVAVWKAREVYAKAIVEDHAQIELLGDGSDNQNSSNASDWANGDLSVAGIGKRDYAMLLTNLSRVPKKKRISEVFLKHGRAGEGLLSDDVKFYNALTKVNWRKGFDQETVEGLSGIEQGIAGLQWDEFDDGTRNNRGRLKKVPWKDVEGDLDGGGLGRSSMWEEEFDDDEFWDVRGKRFAEVEAFNEEIGATDDSFMSDETWAEMAAEAEERDKINILKRDRPNHPERIAWEEKLRLEADAEEDKIEKYLDADAVLGMLRGKPVEQDEVLEVAEEVKVIASSCAQSVAAVSEAAVSETTASQVRFGPGSERGRTFVARGGGDEPSPAVNISPELMSEFPLLNQTESRPWTEEEKVELQLAVMKQTYGGSLSRAPLSDLVKTLRVSPPEHFTHQTVAADRFNLAMELVDNAVSTGEVDVVVLNAALSVIAGAGRLRTGLTFFQEKFEECGIKPNSTSVKIVIEMLVGAKRIEDAMAFAVENGDLLSVESYSHLIKFYGDRGKLMEGLELLKECHERFDTIPAERFIRQLRLSCRHQGLTNFHGSVITNNVVKKFREGEEEEVAKIDSGLGTRDYSNPREKKRVEKFDFSAIVPNESRRGLTGDERALIEAIELLPADPSAYVRKGMGREGKRHLGKNYNKHGWQIRNKGLHGRKGFIT